MNRAEFQRLADERLADAKALLAAKRWSAAYYLAGYAVECGLKACVLASVGAAPEVLFEDRRFSEKCWTHNLRDLMELAGLTAAFAIDAAADSNLLANWDTVKEWREGSRYERQTIRDARALYDSIADNKHGVLVWIKRSW